MFLALRELRRAKVRFGLLIGAIAMLVFLILFQQSLQNGLITSFVGAIQNQNAPVLVYAVDGQRVLQGSVITDELDQVARSVDGVDEVGRIGQSTFTGRLVVADEPAESLDTTVIGYDAAADGSGLGAPATVVAGRLPSAPFEAIASDADVRLGFDVGSTIELLPGGVEFVIVGLAEDVQLNVTPTLFTPYESFVEAIKATNPDAGEPRPNALAMRPVEGLSDEALVANINALSEELDALTRSDAAAEAPGVAQVQQSFRIILVLYGLVVPFVTGLFFLIVTLQKAEALTLLRAIGAPARRLVASLMLQVLVIIAAGLTIGIGLYAPLSQQRLGGIPLRFETNAVIAWSFGLLALGVMSSLLSARRVLAIDPITATTGGGVGR